jgi:hypothetical protein
MSNYKLYEDINPDLRAVAERFDCYCQEKHIEYTIESDEHDEQGFHVKQDDVNVLRNYMDEACADHKVVMTVQPDKFGNLFLFRLESLQEVEAVDGENLPEDQYKYGSRKLIRAQSAYPSSFGKTKSFGGRGGAKNESFEDSLKQKLEEGVALGIVPSQTLLVAINTPRGGTRVSAGPAACQPDLQNEPHMAGKALLEKANEMLRLIESASHEWPEIANLVKTIINKLEAETQSGMSCLDDIIDSELP